MRRGTLWVGAVLLGAVTPWPAAGQVREEDTASLSWAQRRAMVLDEGGELRFPTPETALRALVEPRDPGDPERSPTAPAVAVLTQLFEPRSRTELDGFAESPVRLALSDRAHFGQVRSKAAAALRQAVRPREGVPYEGAFVALVRLYETYIAGLAAEDRNDPIGALFARNIAEGSNEFAPGYRLAGAALNRVYAAEPEGRGRDYLLAVLEAADPPATFEEGKYSTWCTANDFIYLRAKRNRGSREAALRALPVDAATYVDLCGFPGNIP